MDFFRTGKLRFLYWLALVQLVGGPLVLLQVTVFCKLALHETPRVGVAEAAARVWQSEDFQAVLAAADGVTSHERKSTQPDEGPKLKLEKAKQPVISWEPATLSLPTCRAIARSWIERGHGRPPGPRHRPGHHRESDRSNRYPHRNL